MDYFNEKNYQNNCYMFNDYSDNFWNSKPYSPSISTFADMEEQVSCSSSPRSSAYNVATNTNEFGKKAAYSSSYASYGAKENKSNHIFFPQVNPMTYSESNFNCPEVESKGKANALTRSVRSSTLEYAKYKAGELHLPKNTNPYGAKYRDKHFNYPENKNKEAKFNCLRKSPYYSKRGCPSYPSDYFVYGNEECGQRNSVYVLPKENHALQGVDKKTVPKDYNEPKVTILVPNGAILEAFTLDHNLSVSNHPFSIDANFYENLLARSDFELELKCYNSKDAQMMVNWPSIVSVTINTTPIHIDRNASHRTLLIKHLCKPGRNILQITVSACCCSHLFSLRQIYRPSVKSVIDSLLRKRTLPIQHCVENIKRVFGEINKSDCDYAKAVIDHYESGLEKAVKGITVSFKCPINSNRIILPSRGEHCKHLQCFDLKTYLLINSEKSVWQCPICASVTSLEDLIIDEYFIKLLNKFPLDEDSEITIDSNATPTSTKNLRIKCSPASFTSNFYIKDELSPGVFPSELSSEYKPPLSQLAALTYWSCEDDFTSSKGKESAKSVGKMGKEEGVASNPHDAKQSNAPNIDAEDERVRSCSTEKMEDKKSSKHTDTSDNSFFKKDNDLSEYLPNFDDVRCQAIIDSSASNSIPSSFTHSDSFDITPEEIMLLFE